MVLSRHGSPGLPEYRVQLDVFSGPLDLLLFLIKREELDIQDISIAKVADQYLEYAAVLEQLDPNAAGDFLVLASTLVEIKSRALLPTPPLEPLDDDDEDPRATLVRELLEYKRFKDAAKTLGSAADERAKRYVRAPAELPKELEGVELEDAQIWDLVAAFGKVMTAIGQGPTRHEVLYDDTPIELWAEELVHTLERDGATPFSSVFSGRRRRVEIVGLFLAVLELVRSRRVCAEQEKNFGEIYLFLLVAEDDKAEPASPTSAPPPAEEPTEESEHEPTE